MDPHSVVKSLSVESTWAIHARTGARTPTFVDLSLAEKPTLLREGSDPAQAVLRFLDEHKQLFQLRSAADELKLDRDLRDALGFRHLVFRQRVRGIPVWGGELTAHVDPEGRLYCVTGNYLATLSGLTLEEPVLSRDEAVRVAVSDLGRIQQVKALGPEARRLLRYDGPKAELTVWRRSPEAPPRVVWHVQIRPNLVDNWYYFVDAASGEILEKYNNTQSDGPTTGTGTDLNGVSRQLHVYQQGSDYYLIDASRPIWQAGQTEPIRDPKGALVTADVRNHDLEANTTLYHVVSPNNTWSDPVAVSAHYNMGAVFEYYYNKFGRKGIDGKGNTIFSIIHVTKDGQSLENAFWNGAAMCYGDGGQSLKPLAGGLDVAAHEMTHGVIQRTVNLEYKFQSGALNESLADIFGAMVDRDDWLIGEDVVKTAVYRSGAMRNMQDPHNGVNRGEPGWQPADMSEFLQLDLSQDNGGVHLNSGIPNRAAYLIADAIGRDKTEKLYYRVLEAHYLNAQSNFVDMRLAALRAAEDFKTQGVFTENDVNAVRAAFDAVGIVGDQGQERPPDLPPVSGEQWIAAINGAADDHSLYALRPVLQSGNDIVQLTTTQVYARTGCPITTSDNGAVVLFIDGDNYIRALTDQGESVISRQGIWNSIALSPDASKLAATTVYQDSLIYVFDLVNPDQSRTFHIYSPGTEENAYIALYADALDWDLSGRYLVYDAFNRVEQARGGALEYWDINILDVQSGKIFPLFPPQPKGISVGNPSFGETSDEVIVFDYVDLNSGVDYILAYDLFSGQLGQIASNGSSVSYARYSTDDRFVVFEQVDAQGIPSLYMIPLADNRIQPAGQPQLYVREGQRPYWFAVGTRTGVADSRREQPTTFALEQNFPNPFNMKTVIRFRLTRPARVELAVFDAAGRQVAELLNAPRRAGEHQVAWNGTDGQGNALPSGVYFCRLKVAGPSGNLVRTRKMVLLK